MCLRTVPVQYNWAWKLRFEMFLMLALDVCLSSVSSISLLYFLGCGHGNHWTGGCGCELIELWLHSP